MKLHDIRERFLAYFQENGHTRIASSSLVPEGDDTLLFTNAGMVQFKDLFLGNKQEKYSRATSSQKCVRAGGKHNDLENVGYTARHHTFFEMLGNFSFGDYSKKQAIEFAWSFLTEQLKIPADKLWVTVFIEDDETAKIWLQDLNISAERFSRCGEKDNFWSMGDTGPCGPCTEIFYDHGPEVAGGPPGTPEEEGDRYVEIWNLVFMQYERHPDGMLSELPKPSVDTGMGLERVAAVMQNVHSNYDIDLFQALIGNAAKILKCADKTAPSLKVISDHIRAASFLIVDGVHPSNEGRGYVLRRIIRRAVRHGHQLGASKPFFHKIVAELVAQMKQAYPELTESQSHIETVIEQEEIQFAKTLAMGMRMLEGALNSAQASQCLPGDVVFKLYDTYGFPVDLTADIAREHSIRLDMKGFEEQMSAQRKRAQSASQFDSYQSALSIKLCSVFEGYSSTHATGTIEGLFKANKPSEAVVSGEEALLVLDKTPFYAESGGQIGDAGLLSSEEGVFEVWDTQKNDAAIVHIGRMLKGEFRKGSTLTAEVDQTRRNDIRRNHSATHLLHAALRQVLGKGVTQKGSLVHSDQLRFDFSHSQPVSTAELEKITDIVNQQIIGNTKVSVEEMTPDQAVKAGAMALFGEKYGKVVRVLSMGNRFSVELCGGTHVERTGDIGLMIILSETGVAAGIRRIEAITGQGAMMWVQRHHEQLNLMSALLKTDSEKLLDKSEQLLKQIKELEKKNAALSDKLASQSGSDLAQQVTQIGDTKVLITQLEEGADPKSLRAVMDQLKQKLGSAVILVALNAGGRAHLIAGVTKDLTDKIKAGVLVNVAAEIVGGKGGGRPDMAQAGGNNPEQLPLALEAAKVWLTQQLG